MTRTYKMQNVDRIYLNVILFTFLLRFLNKYLISDLINTTIHVVIIFFEQLFGLCPLLRVAESSWIHSSYSYSCKEKRRCGRGNCNLKRNVTNLLSWNILLTKKIYFEPPTSTFQAIIILLKFYFREKISFITNLQFQQHFIFILTFFLACRDNVTPKSYYKIRKKEDTIFHCFSSFYIVMKICFI